MAAKDLEDVFMNLNLEFVDLKVKMNALTQKYEKRTETAKRAKVSMHKV